MLLGYSPYHRVEEATNYPSMLFITGERDTRCNPAHVRKMTARLQERQAQKNTILMDYSSERGHAAGMPLSTRIEGLARRLFFIVTEIGFAQELEHRDSQRHDADAAQ